MLVETDGRKEVIRFISYYHHYYYIEHTPKIGAKREKYITHFEHDQLYYIRLFIGE